MQLNKFHKLNHIMKLSLIVCLQFVVLLSCGQVQWNQSSDWTIYQSQASDIFKVPNDSLNSLDTLGLNKDTVESYLSSLELFHPKAPVAWMGGYIATCKIDGVRRKIDLSNYGGFFYDEKTNAFYRVSKDRIDSWVDYVQSSYLTLLKKKKN
jgi:hypothetical protein